MLLPERLKRVGTPLEALVRAWIAFNEESPSGGNARDLSAEMQQEGNRRLELATPAGRVIDFRRSAMPDGRSIITAADITARREAERMKDEFVSAVSHELRTPLTAIAGSLGLLAAGAAGALTERTRHLLDIARKNSDRLTRLINDLLDIGKMEAGKLPLALRPVPLAEALRQAAEQNRPYAERLGVGISLDLPGEELVACADPDRL